MKKILSKTNLKTTKIIPKKSKDSFAVQVADPKKYDKLMNKWKKSKEHQQYMDAQEEHKARKSARNKLVKDMDETKTNETKLVHRLEDKATKSEKWKNLSIENKLFVRTLLTTNNMDHAYETAFGLEDPTSSIARLSPKALRKKAKKLIKKGEIQEALHEVMDHFFLDEVSLVRRLSEIVNLPLNDKDNVKAVLTAINLSFKVRGSFAPEKHIHDVKVVHTIDPEEKKRRIQALYEAHERDGDDERKLTDTDQPIIDVEVME